MNRFFIILLISVFFQSCNDGDVIITNFNFEDAELKTCGDIGNYVFYKENPQVFESLSLKLGTTDSIYKTEGEKVYELSGSTNFVNYRSYDGRLGNNYFCSSIPPTSPKVETNYLAVSGTAIVTVTFEYENPVNKNTDNSYVSNGDKKINSNRVVNPQQRNTLRKNVQIILKNLVLVSGENQIIQETLDMGTIENVQVVEITP